MTAPTVLLGAVAYDPKVVTIWDGLPRAGSRRGACAFDYVLYSHYERQVEDLIAGRIDVAWNSPLAWVRAERLAAASGTAVRALDHARHRPRPDLGRRGARRLPVRQLADLRRAGRRRRRGRLAPGDAAFRWRHLRGGRASDRFDVRRFDVGVGLHGDHVGGERDAARALVAGEVDAACMIDGNHLAFVREGTLPPEGTRIAGADRAATTTAT